MGIASIHNKKRSVQYAINDGQRWLVVHLNTSILTSTAECLQMGTTSYRQASCIGHQDHATIIRIVLIEWEGDRRFDSSYVIVAWFFVVSNLHLATIRQFFFQISAFQQGFSNKFGTKKAHRSIRQKVIVVKWRPDRKQLFDVVIR